MKKNEKEFIPNDGLAARKIAIEILLEVLERFIPLDDVFSKFLKKGTHLSKMKIEDRSFCRLLVSSTLRNLTEIDYILNKFLTKPLAKSPTKTQMILRVGITQILYLKTPSHAATNTSVELGGKKWKGLINAIMRGVIREKEKIKKYQSESIKIPLWLSKRWKRDWKEQYPCIEKSHLLLSPPIDICVKNEPELWANKLGGDFISNKTVRLKNTGLITELEGFNEGDWWVQDYSSQIPAALMNIKQNDEVLDLCAAPGGKTSQLIAMGAKVTSVDSNKKRIARLKENLARLSFDALIIHSDIRNFFSEKKWSKILLDVPCSSTGTLRKHPDIMHLKKEDDILSLSILQRQLLDSSWKLLKKDGCLIYCTCSLEKDEGEDQISRFLKDNKDAKIDKIIPSEVQGVEDLITTEGLLRIFPDKFSKIGGIDGFFVARLKKVS
jgi:16S rRNA (cytosine967-C5)-methyltransferase